MLPQPGGNSMPGGLRIVKMQLYFGKQKMHWLCGMKDRNFRQSPSHGPRIRRIFTLFKFGRVSTDQRFEKVQQKSWKMFKFTKLFCRLSIPTARGCASIILSKIKGGLKLEMLLNVSTNVKSLQIRDSKNIINSDNL